MCIWLGLIDWFSIIIAHPCCSMLESGGWKSNSPWRTPSYLRGLPNYYVTQRALKRLSEKIFKPSFNKETSLPLPQSQKGLCDPCVGVHVSAFTSVLSGSLQERTPCRASQWTVAREILQASVWAWVAMSSFRGSFRPRDRKKPCAYGRLGESFLFYMEFFLIPLPLCAVSYTADISITPASVMGGRFKVSHGKMSRFLLVIWMALASGCKTNG